MSELMERLRLEASEAVNWSALCGHLFDEAADRIEALEAALREAIPCLEEQGYLPEVARARAALAPEQDSTDHIDWDTMAEERLGQRPRSRKHPMTEAKARNDALRLLADLFSESVHETWTKEEIVNIIEDAIRLGS